MIAACAGVADIVFVLDNSGSLQVSDWATVTEFCADVVQNLFVASDAVRVATVVYDATASVAFNLRRYETKQDIIDAIQNLPYREGPLTRTDLALNLVRTDVLTSTAGARDDVNDICIVVTDGQSAVPTLTIMAALRAHDADITMFAVGKCAHACSVTNSLHTTFICLSIKRMTSGQVLNLMHLSTIFLTTNYTQLHT